MLFVNFKNYPQAFEGFPEIYRDLEGVVKRYPKTSTVFAPPPLLLSETRKMVQLSLWAQHLDPVPLGPCTGFLPAEAVKKVGGSGTFLNHSENPLNPTEIEKALAVARRVGLRVLVFASTLKAVSEAKNLNPDYIAYEPPELIGGNVSVTTAKAEIIPEAVKEAKPVPLLVGAGIRKGGDIKTALRMGSAGGVVSSAIVTAPQPMEVLSDLLSSF